MKKLTILFAALSISACQSTQVKTQEDIDQNIALQEEIEILKNGGMCAYPYYFASKDMVINSSEIKKVVNSYNGNTDFVDLRIDENQIITAYYNYESILKFDFKKNIGSISNDSRFMIYESDNNDIYVSIMRKPNEYEMISGCSNYAVSTSLIEEYNSSNLIK